MNSEVILRYYSDLPCASSGPAHLTAIYNGIPKVSHNYIETVHQITLIIKKIYDGNLRLMRSSCGSLSSFSFTSLLSERTKKNHKIRILNNFYNLRFLKFGD